MWLIFDSIEHRTDLESRKGTTYSGYVLSGLKKGYDTEPDEPYSKILFDGTIVTVIQGASKVQMDLVEFFQQCNKDDLVVIKQEKAGAEKWNWKITEVENRTRKVVDNTVFPQMGNVNQQYNDPIISLVVQQIMTMPDHRDAIKDKSMEEMVQYIINLYQSVQEVSDGLLTN